MLGGMRIIKVKKLQCTKSTTISGSIINVEFQNGIHMLTQVVENKLKYQRVGHKDVANTSRISEFLRITPLEFTGSNIIEGLENFVKELQNVFEVIRVANTVGGVRFFQTQWSC